jgi:two-component system, LytTR family, sensor kinase
MVQQTTNSIFKNGNFQITLYILITIFGFMHFNFFIIQKVNIAVLIVDVAVSSVVLYFCCYLQANLLSYYTPRGGKQLLILVWALLFAALWTLINYGAIYVYFNNDIVYNNLFIKSWLLRLVIGWQFIAGVGFYNLLWNVQQYQEKVSNMQQQAKALSNDAELYKLRQQMQPHFLFNSLNSINALISIDTGQARKMILQLSEYMRATLKKEDKEMVSLADEISYLKLYLEIEQVRFGQRLKTEISIPQQLLSCKVPVLLLQPVLENAIKYGLYNTVNQVNILLWAEDKDTNITICISNPYDTDGIAKNKGTGFGLGAVEKRIQLQYGVYNAVSTIAENNIFTTKITIPKI